MKIIYNKYLPPKQFLAINLFGVLFVRPQHKGQLTLEDINHETIHTAQMKELFYILFYLCYIIEWIYRLIQYRNCMQAYYHISFEREAYTFQNDRQYLSQRKYFAQWRKK